MKGLTLAHLIWAVFLLTAIFFGAQYLGQTYIFHEEWHDPTINKGAQFETVP